MSPSWIRSAVVAVLALAAVAGAADKPLKVFILAGQSNMQGHASVSTFDSLADDPKTARLLKSMRGPDGKPKVCDKVWITSVGCLGDAYSDLREQTGKLTAGFGAFGAEGNRIGPEYLFGIAMEERLGEPVLLIKTSWGGRSLHTDFRPPSGGAFEWNEAELARRKKRGDDIEKLKAEKLKTTGVYYREMIAHVQKVLKDIKRVVPHYDEKRGYELAGFVWFQGFNDYVDSGVYPDRMKPDGYDMYALLLGHLIRRRRNGHRRPGGGQEAADGELPRGPAEAGVAARVQGQREGGGDGPVLGR
jgi:alpha-galactosidase